jgi:hypothetical protein
MTRAKASPILKSVVIHQLQVVAGELKRTPTTADIEVAARQKQCSGVETIGRMFGSLRAALTSARLPLNTMQEFSEHELIVQLQDLSGRAYAGR